MSHIQAENSLFLIFFQEQIFKIVLGLNVYKDLKIDHRSYYKMEGGIFKIPLR